jgi:hypothetical protein
VAAFEAILATADEPYRSGQRSDFEFSDQRSDAESEFSEAFAGVA